MLWRGLPLVILLAVALGLRGWRLGHGLPDFLEEAMPLRQAMKMWERGGGLAPDFFHYPSLTIYLNYLIIWIHAKISLGLGTASTPADVWLMLKTDPSAVVLASRAVNILADLASVWAVWRIGRAHNLRTASVAGLLVALSPTMISQSRLIVIEPIMTALLLWFLDRLITYGRSKNCRDIILAIILGGLATGAKYNAGLIVFPFLVFWWRTARWQTLLRTPLCLIGSGVVFLLTSPYVLIDFSAFWSAFLFESRHMATGHLGTLGQSGVGYLVGIMVSGFGWVGLGFLALWIMGLVKGRFQARNAEILTLSLLLPLLISVAGFRMHAVRYVVPLIPLMALGIAFGVDGILCNARVARVRQSWVPVVVAVLVLFWPLFGGLTAARKGAESTQIQARRWLEKNLDPEAVLVQEEYGPVLLTPAGKQAVMRDSRFAQVNPTLAAQFHQQREYRSSTLTIAVSGDMTFRVSPEGTAIPLFQHPSDFGGVLYHPQLLSGLDYFITSGGVQERYQADSQRFSRQADWYSILEKQAEVVAEFVPDGVTSGPRITVHALHRRAPQAPQELDAVIPWWASTIRPEFWTDIDVARPTLSRSRAIQVLAPYFSQMVQPLLNELGRHHLDRGNLRQAIWLAEQVLEVEPADLTASLTYSRAQVRTGHPEAAIQRLKRAIDLCRKTERLGDSHGLRFELANVLRTMNREDQARKELQIIFEELPFSDPKREVVRKILNRFD
jgi:hypothetical protein